MSEAVYWPYTGFTDLGDCVCTSLYDECGEMTGVRVDRADPRVLISGKLLWDFHCDGMKFGSLKCVSPVEHGFDGTSACPVGDVFTIDGVNRRVVYVVTGRDPRWLEGLSQTYIAEWPD